MMKKLYLYRGSNLERKMPPKISLNTSNYVTSGTDEVESINTARVSANVPALEGGVFSVDFGADIVSSPSEAGMTTSAKPIVEVKYKQNFASVPIFDTSMDVRGYVRYRHIGEDTNQLRVAGGVSIPVSKNTSIYADAHYTTKFQDGKDNAGFWIGASYKANNKLSLWVEPVQMNFALDGSGKTTNLMNVGLTYNF